MATETGLGHVSMQHYLGRDTVQLYDVINDVHVSHNTISCVHCLYITTYQGAQLKQMCNYMYTSMLLDEYGNQKSKFITRKV